MEESGRWKLELVHELIEGGKWKNDLLQHWFNETDVNLITNIPLSLYDRKDRLFWNYSKSGIYTVKSGYAVAKEQSEKGNQRLAPDPEISWEVRKHTVWKRLWGLNVKMKLKHFLWRCLQNGMATNEALYKRLGTSNKICYCCGEETETIKHIFFFYPKAKVVWKLAPVRWEGLVALQGKLWRWWEAVMQVAKETQGVDRIRLTVQQQWEPPKEGTMMMNIDAAISAKMVRSGLGIIARNWRGVIVKVKGITDRRKGDAATEETLAIRSALEMAQGAGWTNIEVQSDCKYVVSLINTDNVQEGRLQTLLEDIDVLKKRFESCNFSFVPRTANSCSHELAQFVVKATRNFE
ncbi:uncharacterized protein [Coffea arabica]|uniref:Uncharacterized protein n=1 Tax=Coffea arabica TaxID=13443 RepID=A0ABM4VCD0_COFAR